MQMGIDVNDEHLSGDETEESELSDYSDSGSELDTLEFLEDLGVGSDVSTPPSAEQAEKALEKRDQRRMARAFLRASKAMRVLARENKAVSEIIARRPGLRSLAEMMAGLGPSPFTALQSPAAPVPVHMPSSARFQLLQQVSQKGIIPAAPKKDKSGQYPCRMPGCDTVSLSWSGADSHMRAVHTQMAYGPCNGCGQCKFNRDSFKRHQKNCMAK